MFPSRSIVAWCTGSEDQERRSDRRVGNEKHRLTSRASPRRSCVTAWPRALVILGLAFAVAPALIRADPKAADDSLKTELATLRSGGKALVVDANGAETRQRYGVIPGAVLLSNYRTYDVTELPRDHAEKLVFYCANEQCMASHKAAKRAADAGYSDVSVLPAGIMGWKHAGQPTDLPGA